MSDHEIGRKEKIQILLAEYSSLRTELIHRGNTSYQMGAFVIAAVAVIVGKGLNWALGAAVSAALLILIGITWRFAMRDMNKIARRVIYLETEINRRAGEELLIYESRIGGATARFWSEFLSGWPFRRAKPTDPGS